MLFHAEIIFNTTKSASRTSYSVFEELRCRDTDASSLEKVLTGYLKRLKVLHRVIKEDRFSSSQTR